MKTLWEGEPLTVIVSPADGELKALDEEKVERIRSDYRGVKIIGNTAIHKEYKRRWEDAKKIAIKDFEGDVEILSREGVKIAFFSGSDEYAGDVWEVWKITKREGRNKAFQLWTTFAQTVL